MRRQRDQDRLPAGQQTSRIPHCDSGLKGRELLNWLYVLGRERDTEVSSVSTLGSSKSRGLRPSW